MKKLLMAVAVATVAALVIAHKMDQLRPIVIMVRQLRKEARDERMEMGSGTSGDQWSVDRDVETSTQSDR